jgi:hypothetical protein
MDAQQVLSNFRTRGIRLIPEGCSLAVEPASRLSDADRAAIRLAKEELLRILAPVPERVIEATFITARASTHNDAEFPPCPVCGQVRYWLTSGGRVLCGTKKCASAQRFQMVALKFHPVN